MILPRQPLDLTTVRTLSPAVPAAPATAMICIVDEQPADYQALLADEGLAAVRLEFVTTGRDALRVAQHQQVSAWVVNIRLSDMGGCELCQMLKAHSPAAVIYMLTDDYQAADERAAWLAGAALFRPKPVDPAWFERVVQRNSLAKAM